MKVKTALIIIIFIQIAAILICVDGKAQSILKGHVSDTSGHYLKSVTVSLVKSSGIIVQFTITDTLGAYQFVVPRNIKEDSLFVTALHEGYFRKIVYIKPSSAVIDIKLIPEIITLPDINVTNSPPLIRKKKDTLEYDVSKFSAPQDRVVGDIIRKLPGIDVDPDGKIFFQGKEISQLYIDGDNLLAGKYNAATNNLPVDFISKIQILENHQEILAIKNLQKSSQPALNLVLSAKAKLKLSGSGSIGVGTAGLYDGGLQSQLFKKNFKSLDFFKINNNGDDLKADINSLVKNAIGPPTIGSLISLPSSNSHLPNHRDLFNHSGLIDINSLYKLNKDVNLTFNSYYRKNSFDQSSSLNRQIFIPGDTLKYKEAQHSFATESNYFGRLSLVKNSPKVYFNISSEYESTPQVQNSNLVAYPGGNINQSLSSNYYHFSNDIRSIFLIRGKYAIEFRSLYLNNNRRELLFSEPSFAQNYIPGINAKGLAQNLSLPFTYTDNYLSTTISGSIIQSYKLGFLAEHMNFISDLQKVINDNSLKSIDDSLKNNFAWDKNMFYAEAVYAYQKEKFQSSLSIAAQNQHITYSNAQITAGVIPLFIMPSLFVKMPVGKEDYFLVNSALTRETGNIQQVYDKYIMLDYRTLSRYSGVLPITKNLTNSLTFNHRKTLKLQFLSAGLLYSVQNKNYISDYTFSTSGTTLKYLALNNQNVNLTSFIGLSKYIFPLETTVSANYSYLYSLYNQYINSELIKSASFNWEMRYKLISKLSNQLNFVYDGKYTFQTVKPGFLSSQKAEVMQKGTMTQHTANFNYTPTLLSTFKFGAEYFTTNFHSGSPNRILFLDLSLSLHNKNGKGDFNLSWNNLLNTDKYAPLTLNPNISELREYRLRSSNLQLKYTMRF